MAKKPKPTKAETETPFQRFQQLTKRLLGVPKAKTQVDEPPDN